jgi:hypothetical protein
LRAGVPALGAAAATLIAAVFARTAHCLAAGRADTDTLFAGNVRRQAASPAMGTVHRS